jgi:hypothetical protein
VGGGGLSCPDDLFDLPDQLRVHESTDKFCRHWEAAEKCLLPPAATANPPPDRPAPRVRLVRLLYRCFGREFLAIGALKFAQDCAGFAGPILLNLVVGFMENPAESVSRGYVYAVLLVSL